MYDFRREAIALRALRREKLFLGSWWMPVSCVPLMIRLQFLKEGSEEKKIMGSSYCDPNSSAGKWHL